MKLRRLSFISVVVCAVIAGAFVPAFAAVDDDVAMIRAILSNSSTGWNAMYSQVYNSYNRLNTYLPNLVDIKNSLSSIDTKVSTSNSNLASINNSIQSSNTLLTSVNSNTSTSASNTSNILSGLSATLPDIKDSVVQLQEVLASDEDLAIRQDQAQRLDQINDDFLSSSGDASVSLGDIGSSKQSVSAIKDSLSGGASASSLWSVLTSNSDGWGWFSQATMNDLDQTGSNRRSAPSYEYLDSYYFDVLSALGGDYND